MNTVERAARALCALDGHPENAKLDGEPLWKNYLPEVRAVLLAIRDPDDAGLEAFARAFNWNWRTYEGRVNARHAWQAMIDVGLGDDTPR